MEKYEANNENIIPYDVTDEPVSQNTGENPSQVQATAQGNPQQDNQNGEATAQAAAQSEPQAGQQNGQQSEVQQRARSKVVINSNGNSGKKKMKPWQKGLLIFIVIVAVIGIGTARCSAFVNGLFEEESTVKTAGDIGYDYIAVVHVEGTISETLEDTYDHEYVMDTIDDLIYDSENKGLILYVETPGGTVYASDELYLKILEYKEETGRPVYSSMQSQATSGGYYISAPCDKIFANRNCWTGSIGVTMGTFMDVSELLENLGIKTETITSGENKAMGSSYEAMTDEQRAIFQSLIDEAYDQFVGIVAEGRDMPIETVKEIADGRIYTAKQALELDLIDAVGTYEEAVEDMKSEYKLGDCDVEAFEPEYEIDLFSLLSSVESIEDLSGVIDAETIQELAELNGKVTLEYMSEVRK